MKACRWTRACHAWRLTSSFWTRACAPTSTNPRFVRTTTAFMAGWATTRRSSSAESKIQPTASWRSTGSSVEAINRHGWPRSLELVEGIEGRVDLVVDERWLAIAAIRAELAGHRSLARQGGREGLAACLARGIDRPRLGRERADHHVLDASRAILRGRQVEEGRLVRDKHALPAAAGEWRAQGGPRPCPPARRPGAPRGPGPPAGAPGPAPPPPRATPPGDHRGG